MKKFKGALLSLVLCMCFIVPVFIFSGCGVDAETVNNSLKELSKVITSNSTVFVEGYVDPEVKLISNENEEQEQNFQIVENSGILTKFKIVLGNNLDKAVKDEIEHKISYGYEELDRKYNVIFAFANEFIETYKVYLPKKDDKLTDETKNCLNILNEEIKVYIETVEEFLKQRKTTDNYYNTTDFEITTGLRALERSYGAMIEKAVSVSGALADVLEANNIINYLKEFNATSDRTMIVEGFVRAKLLPVYSTFMLSEIKNKIWWESTIDEDGSTKAKITTLISKLEESFNSFKNYVKKSTITDDKTDKDVFEAVELKPLVENLVNVFVVDAEQYETALKELNIQKLSVEYKNDLAKYVKESNAFAQTYLDKIEDFLYLILGQFQNDFYGQVLI